MKKSKSETIDALADIILNILIESLEAKKISNNAA